MLSSKPQTEDRRVKLLNKDPVTQENKTWESDKIFAVFETIIAS